jgi:hypothetical protein
MKVGSLYEMGVWNERHVYVHYIHADSMGPIVQVYECERPLSSPLTGMSLSDCIKPFGQVICGIGAAVKNKRWKAVAVVPPPEKIEAKFIGRGLPDREGKNVWWLYDGTREMRIGSVLPPDLLQVESLSIWPAELLEDRIRTGTNPFSLEAMSKWGPLGSPEAAEKIRRILGDEN